jgi:hypothetical protein
MFIILGFYKSTNESKGRYIKSNTLLPKNRFEGKYTKTKAKNPNKVSKRGTTNSTNNSTKIKFQNQNRTCKGTYKFAKLDLNIKVKEGPETYIINQIYNQIFKSI